MDEKRGKVRRRAQLPMKPDLKVKNLITAHVSRDEEGWCKFDEGWSPQRLVAEAGPPVTYRHVEYRLEVMIGPFETARRKKPKPAPPEPPAQPEPTDPDRFVLKYDGSELITFSLDGDTVHIEGRGLVALLAEQRAEISEVRAEARQQVDAVRAELQQEIDKLGERLAEVRQWAQSHSHSPMGHANDPKNVGHMIKMTVSKEERVRERAAS